ncbi:MAG TPA: RidA family protein [Candidatus Binataceae bacterium]|jgi:enamine deaminase RidA (YjgF/YER057c/UK114 family)
MKKQFINPAGLAPSPAYTHSVAVEGGVKMIFLAGQVAIDERGKIVGAGDLAVQTRKAFDNLALALGGAGATPADVVKLNLYVVNYKPSDYASIREVRTGFFPPGKPPASTLVGVAALALDGLLIEVEAIAMVG